jgi:hypothetical protein
MQEAPDRVGEGDWAAVRQAGQLLVRVDRLEVVRGGRRGHLDQLDRQHPVRAGSTANLEELVEVLHGRCRAERGESVLHLLGPHGLGDVA